MYVDSDYASDIDTRKSRAGYLIYLNGNLISYRSCLQPDKVDITTGTCGPQADPQGPRHGPQGNWDDSSLILQFVYVTDI